MKQLDPVKWVGILGLSILISAGTGFVNVSLADSYEPPNDTGSAWFEMPDELTDTEIEHIKEMLEEEGFDSGYVVPPFPHHYTVPEFYPPLKSWENLALPNPPIAPNQIGQIEEILEVAVDFIFRGPLMSREGGVRIFKLVETEGGTFTVQPFHPPPDPEDPAALETGFRHFEQWLRKQESVAGVNLPHSRLDGSANNLREFRIGLKLRMLGGIRRQDFLLELKFPCEITPLKR